MFHRLDTFLLSLYLQFAVWWTKKTYTSSQVLYHIIVAITFLMSCVEIAVIRHPAIIISLVVVVWIYYTSEPMRQFTKLGMSSSIMSFVAWVLLGLFMWDIFDLAIALLTGQYIIKYSLDLITGVLFNLFWYAARMPFVDPPPKPQKMNVGVPVGV